MFASSNQITKLLHAIEGGESGAAADLLPVVYDELRAHAGNLMAAERRGHTLQRTALVHEAYLKLIRGDVSFQSRLHFFNAAALAMRRILVDHATRRATLKRGGARDRVELDALDDVNQRDEVVRPDGEKKKSREVDWLELDAALHLLERTSSRQHQVVMLRFFSGRTEAEIAKMLDISEPTVRRDWATARVWLYRAIRQRVDR